MGLDIVEATRSAVDMVRSFSDLQWVLTCAVGGFIGGGAIYGLYRFTAKGNGETGTQGGGVAAEEESAWAWLEDESW